MSDYMGYGTEENENMRIKKHKDEITTLTEQLKQAKLKSLEDHNGRELYWADIMLKRDKEIEDLKANKEELEAALKILTELYDKNVASKGHEYEVSNMVDRSLSFLEKKVDRADVLLKNPHKIFFIKSKKPKEVKA